MPTRNVFRTFRVFRTFSKPPTKRRRNRHTDPRENVRFVWPVNDDDPNAVDGIVFRVCARKSVDKCYVRRVTADHARKRKSTGSRSVRRTVGIPSLNLTNENGNALFRAKRMLVTFNPFEPSSRVRRTRLQSDFRPFVRLVRAPLRRVPPVNRGPSAKRSADVVCSTTVNMTRVRDR